MIWRFKVNNVMHFFDSQKYDSNLTLQLITANSESKFLHLYHYSFQMDLQYFNCETPGIHPSF